MDPAQARQERRRRWAAASAGWLEQADKFRRDTMPISIWMVEAIQPQPGDTVLELAAGTGDVGYLAAEMIEPGGTLITSDFSPEMLAAAQKRADALGVRNARFRQIDAEAIDLETASVDGVLCRFGYMLMPDPQAALRETRRVLKSGGRVSLAVWRSPEENPWLALPTRELVRRGWLDPPQPGEPGPFGWAAGGAVAEHLQDAGFTDFEIAPVDIDETAESFEAWLEVTARMSRNFAAGTEGRSPEEIEDLRAALREAAKPWERPDGRLAFPGAAWAAWAAA